MKLNSHQAKFERSQLAAARFGVTSTSGSCRGVSARRCRRSRNLRNSLRSAAMDSHACGSADFDCGHSSPSNSACLVLASSGVRLQRVPADGGNAGICGTACARGRFPDQTSTKGSRRRSWNLRNRSCSAALDSHARGSADFVCGHSLPSNSACLVLASSGVRLQRVPADGGNAGICGTACERGRFPDQASTKGSRRSRNLRNRSCPATMDSHARGSADFVCGHSLPSNSVCVGVTCAFDLKSPGTPV
ncbi:MAG: hypothetical protein RLZZ116_2286 [Planctomycetota bacterium]